LIFGGKKLQSRVVLLVLTSIFLIFVTDLALAEESTVTRSLSTSTPTGNSIFNITLQISNMQVGGIVETIPDGFSYVSTTHPEAQVEQSGQNLVFSVIGETELSYLVRAPSSGSGTFTGEWDNTLTGTNGQISDSSVTVAGTGSKSSGGSGSGNLVTSSASPEGTEQATTSGSTQPNAAGPDSEQKASLKTGSETKNETSSFAGAQSNAGAQSETEGESIPFISPAFFILIFGIAAVFTNGRKGVEK